MSAQRYILDTSALIDLVRNYPEDIFSKHWARIYEMIGSGELISHVMVYRELTQGPSHQTDPSYLWAHANKALFTDDEEAVAKRSFELVREHPNMVDPTKEYEDADPYLVALAEIHGGCGVVTNEGSNGYHEHNRIKIPDVCTHRSIPVFNLFDFFRSASVLGL